MYTSTTLSKVQVSYFIKFITLLIIATGAPLLGLHSQWITGPIVNAVLILSVFLVGIRGALLIGMLPSTIALGTGLLPALLAPMIPFIIISNSILVLVIDQLKNNNFFSSLFVAATFKFLFLFSTSNIVISLLLKKELGTAVSQLMSWPQFFTALLGGLLAFIILKIIKKTNAN